MTILEKITSESVLNPHLRSLVEQLKQGYRSEVELLRITPETAQKIPLQWHHHTDHSDYSETRHTDDGGSHHSDYCD